MTDILDKVEQLVYAYDLSTLGVEAILPDEVKVLEITEDVLKDSIPSLERRADLVSYSACYYAFLNQNPSATRDDFNAVLNPEALEQVSTNIRTKLKDPLTLSDVVEFHKNNKTLLTRVDLNRQVKT
jgi:Flp pilus assembly CpaF family ATPase